MKLYITLIFSLFLYYTNINLVYLSSNEVIVEKNECKYFKKSGKKFAKNALNRNNIIWCVDYHDKYSFFDEEFQQLFEKELKKHNIQLLYDFNNDELMKCYNEGVIKVMKPIIEDKFESNFLDIIVANTENIYIDKLKSKKTVEDSVCGNEFEIKECGTYRPPLLYLKSKLSKKPEFYFSENVVGASVLRFDVLIDRQGIVKEFSFTEKEYIPNVPRDMKRKIEKFIKDAFLNENIYPICDFDGKWKHIKKQEFIAVRVN